MRQAEHNTYIHCWRKCRNAPICLCVCKRFNVNPFGVGFVAFYFPWFDVSFDSKLAIPVLYNIWAFFGWDILRVIKRIDKITKYSTVFTLGLDCMCMHLHVRKLLRHSSIINTLYIILPFKLSLGNTFWKTCIYKYPPPSLSWRFNIWENCKKTSTVLWIFTPNLLFISPKYSIFWLSLYLLMWLLTLIVLC